MSYRHTNAVKHERKALDLFKSPSETIHELTIICRYERNKSPRVREDW